jgi:hypothetical protein
MDGAHNAANEWRFNERHTPKKGGSSTGLVTNGLPMDGVLPTFS